MPLLKNFEERVVADYAETTDFYKNFQIHCHNMYEVYYFIDGDADFLVEGKLYHPKPHSLILIAPHVFHGARITSQKTYCRYTLHFDPNLIRFENRSFLLSSFPGTKQKAVSEVFYEDVSAFHLTPFLSMLVKVRRMPANPRDKLNPIYLEALLAQINFACNNSMVLHSDSSTSTIADVIAYINENIHEKITLESLSNQFFISKTHLNRLFHQAIGTTFFDYLVHKRIVYAQQLFLSGMSASEVATKVGFHDYSSFYRAYKKITGHSPEQDRKKG